MIRSVHYLCGVLFLLPLVFLGCKNEQPDSKAVTLLPRSVPETEGVSSEGIIEFLDAAASSRHEFHSFMFLRHGKVIAEGWWAPYEAELKHTLYSTSKSFTSTAVGFAVSKHLLAVEDKVISFFPNELPDSVSPYLADMTVKDLLTMSVGQEPDPTHIIVPSDSNWVKAFLALPVIHDPGTKFLYNSMATFMLSAIVQKVTGEKVIDYLKPRLFDPLGIEGMDWEVSPRGINTGGWGLRLKTEDMARFGQLLLQKGKWNGKQIVPAEWIEEASSFKIDQAPGVDQAVKDSSDWMQGYCYQFWRCRNNGFRADGAYGQYIIVLPEKDAVIAITAESPDMQDEINLVWNYLLPAITDESLPENNEAYTALTQKLQTLALPIPAKSSSPLAESISGKTFILEPNDRKLEAITLNFTGEACDATLKIDHVEYDLLFGAGEWITGETSKPGPNLISLPGSLPTSKIACTYCWKDDQTVELILRYIESPHTEMVICKFNKNKVEVTTHLSIPPGYDLPVIIGTMEGE